MQTNKINWERFQKYYTGGVLHPWSKVKKIKAKAHGTALVCFLLFGLLGSLLTKIEFSTKEIQIILLILCISIILSTFIYSIIWPIVHAEKIKKIYDDFDKQIEKQRSNYFYENYNQIQIEKDFLETSIVKLASKNFKGSYMLQEVITYLKNNLETITELE